MQGGVKKSRFSTNISLYLGNDARNSELHSLSKVQFYKQCILSKLSQLNTSKSPGPDGFHPRVLFEIRNELLEPLEILFTALFATGQLPEDWRTANITAIYKKGSKTDPSNYNKSNEYHM